MALFNDQPLAGPDLEDTLGMGEFADALSAFIKECETPMAIGIQGDWGLGKTSLMKMISRNLQPKKKSTVNIQEIWLNTWHYSLFKQDEYLGLVVISALLEQIQEAFGIAHEANSPLTQLRKRLGQVVGMLSKVQVGLPGIGGLTAKDAYESFKDESGKPLEIENISKVLDEFKTTFAQLIHEHVGSNQRYQRLVFYIDDLDRVRPAKAVELLEALKLFMDVENCVFVLAVDYEVIQLGIAEKFGKNIQRSTGKSFFDKIIQLPFSMPVSSYSLNKYLENLIQKSALSGYAIKSEFFEDIADITIGRNPRSIKRAINYATLLDKIRKANSTSVTKKSELHVKLLYSAVCWQLAWPELFEYFVQNPTAETIENLENWDFLQTLPAAMRLFARVHNPEQTRDNIAAYFDTLYEMLDLSQDALITDQELQPLLTILRLVRLVSERNITKSESPLRTFENTLAANCSSNSSSLEFYRTVWSRSYWTTSNSINYKRVGKRYTSILYNRRQIGSISTFKTRPLSIRLKIVRQALLHSLAGLPDAEIYSNILRETENPAGGIGDTELNISALLERAADKSREVLNNLFEAFVQHSSNPQ